MYREEAVSQLLAAGLSELEFVQRLTAIDCALQWVGTPYHPHATVKGAGCDCATLLGAVYHAAGVLPQVQLGYYSPEWHLHQDEDLYRQNLQRYAHRVDRETLPGDIALFQFGRSPSHGAIVLYWPYVIHAYIGKGVVIEEVGRSPLVIAKNRELSEGRFDSLWSPWEN